ncbi:sigma-70 family RNA polymerase sigma factor [Phytoactinopolyspora endophytica]|uniref:sigma-70 family RNA polymerase sigma factor n=1 Tax=Phytoactinopolyspora endophytica TaxID=1642495 RepID=UPI00101C45AA|nr:sigma-70 family RNA polymerase sigma factor [Phytoactinopolyspora endophytica]
MDDHDELAARFEAERSHLRGVAYRILGSPVEAEDAVQETWLRLNRVDPGAVENLPGWLRTVISRVCLDMLRSRASRREEPVGQRVTESVRDAHERGDPEYEALLVDSVGRAMLVVLDTLGPAERVAFVLHDTFAMPFDEIAPIVGRSTVATKKLASRARHRVQGTPAVSSVELSRHRRVVEAFLDAARGGDVEAFLAVLAPDVVRRAEPAVLPPDVATEVRGAQAVAEEAAILGRQARFAEVALVDGAVGIVVAPRGRLRLIITITVKDDKVSEYEVIADPDRRRRFALAVLDG